MILNGSKGCTNIGSDYKVSTRGYFEDLEKLNSCNGSIQEVRLRLS